MRSWANLAVAVAVPAAAIFFVVLAAVCLRCRRRRNLRTSDSGLPVHNTVATKESMCFYRSDTAGLRFQHLDRPHRGKSRRHRHHHRQLHPRGSDFSWDDHPALVEEAVEGGWSRFAFVGRSNSWTQSTSLLGSCVACDQGRPPWSGTEVGWEVPAGSSEFLQTVRLDPGDGSIPLDGNRPSCVSRMSLPLPGPPLSADSPSFPQEAYFEITIMHLQRPQRRQQQLPKRWSKRVKDNSSDANWRKLINQDVPSHAAFSGDTAQEQEPKILTGERSSGKEVADAIMWVGLTRDGTPTESTPGSHLGSIGFNSNGSVCLDGIKLVLESETGRWGAVNKVVGCGFDPGRKTVFFTLDSMLLHVVRCRSDAFGGPLYPALAANADAMVTVNLGQCAFRYPPANAYRTPNPCFVRPSASASAHIRYDDSRELFSMDRIDSQWRDIVSSKKTSQVNGGSGCRDAAVAAVAAEGCAEEEDRADGGEGSVVVDTDAESDLFEISLNK